MQRLLVFLAAAGILLAGSACAELADLDQARQVCENWLTCSVDRQGDWAGSAEPRVVGVDEVFHQNILVGYNFTIEPSGYVLVPAFKELAPIKASSEIYNFDPHAEGGFSLLARENLYNRMDRYARLYGDPAAEQSQCPELPLTVASRAAWHRLLVDGESFAKTQHNSRFARQTTVGPLMTTAWHQGSPYNGLCPIGDDGLCIVGCVATAIAQVMAYHAWPPLGEGHHQYYWSGDGSCGGVPRGDTLTADFDDFYEWTLIPDVCTDDSPQRIKDAVAELCYEVGVSVNMNYGCCWSGTDMFYALTAMPDYFRYQDVALREDRSDYTPETWFNLLCAEVDRDQPALYAISLTAGGGHAIVVDGWRDVAGLEQIHINYGWADSHTTWYSLDDIYLSDDTQTETMMRNIMPDQSVTAVIETTDTDLGLFSLNARPNPCNPRTVISFELPEQATVELCLFDVAGHVVKTLIAGEEHPAGIGSVAWNGLDTWGRAVPSGTYFYRLQAKDYSETKQVTLIR